MEGAVFGIFWLIYMGFMLLTFGLSILMMVFYIRIGYRAMQALDIYVAKNQSHFSNKDANIGEFFKFKQDFVKKKEEKTKESKNDFDLDK